jgi:hypothetical protein
VISITLEPADNGLIKFLLDDNVNGGGEEFTSRTVYEFEGLGKRKNQVKFVKDLILDLGIDSGTALDKDQLMINSQWGASYEPSKQEIKNKISFYEAEIKRLSSQLER